MAENMIAEPATIASAQPSKAKRKGKRRLAGEGAIFERSDGRWCAALNLGWQDGRRIRKYVYGATARERITPRACRW